MKYHVRLLTRPKLGFHGTHDHVSSKLTRPDAHFNPTAKVETFEQGISISPTSQLYTTTIWLSETYSFTVCVPTASRWFINFPIDPSSRTLKDKSERLTTQALWTKCDTSTPVWSTHGSNGPRWVPGQINPAQRLQDHRLASL
jgi:hypothetical protein